MIAVQNNTNSNAVNNFFPAHQKAGVKLHATPYNIDASGFYFGSYNEYKEKFSKEFDCYGNLVEEYEIQLISADDEDCELFSAMRVAQHNLEQFFDVIEMITSEKAALYFLLERGYDFIQAQDLVDDVTITEQTLKNAAEEFFDECYLHAIPEAIQSYIDYDRFAHDLELSGDFQEFEFGGVTYTCTNANSL